MSGGAEEQFDLVVVGSGAGGMTAALTAHDAGLSTVIIEKSRRFGGSTSISGGGIWIPNNPTLRSAGRGDSRDRVLTYLRQVSGGRVAEARLEAYVDHGPAAMQMLDRSRWWKASWVRGYADYHPEFAGGSPSGRSIEPTPIDTRKLEDDEQYMHPNGMAGPLGLWVTQKDYHDLAMAKRTWRGRLATVRAAWRVSSNMVRRRHMATGGRALSARLRLALKDAEIPLWTRCPMTDLLVEDEAVVGVSVMRNGVNTVLRARRGVVLAAGGFEHNQQMRDAHLPDGARPNRSLGVRSNTGDAIAAAQKLGAATDLLNDAWWMPSIEHPMGPSIPLVSERAIPGQVIVSGDGKRFTNEASPYVNFVHHQLEGKHVPVWLVMDSRARARYPFAQILPGKEFPDAFYQKGIVHRAETLTTLANSVGLPADALSATISRFNRFARAGVDEDFGRGRSAHDRYYGDPSLPNPNLAPVERPPFYAIRIDIGDLGTKGGLVTDEHARVLRPDNTPIRGLYATGNTAASVMGNDYAGPGATIGPAIVFGYLAARHAAGLPAA
ncbi:FAD-binding protein [Mycobacterium sherrisii]|uniref:FAD-binding protein n=1 Tax=Mycobacterium sherrisii TaxID=243061 RepID=UPI003974B0D3